jgi:hypothetical protein
MDNRHAKKQIPIGPSALVQRKGLKFTMLLLCSIGLILATGYASPPKEDPFKVPKAEVRAEVKTIALSPLKIPTDLEDPKPVGKEFETLIESQLKKGGFLVIPANRFGEIWTVRTQSSGGFFDPVTGKLDEAKYNAIRTRALQDARVILHADAVLFPGIQEISAPYAAGLARWHGTSERVISGAQDAQVVRQRGTVHAFSLKAILQNCDGRTLFENYGGIQLSSKLREVSLTFIPVARSELFADPKRDQGAVELALDPLVK